jgi:hypothetical protein
VIAGAKDKKPLPADITSYDLVKAFAVIIMIIDHIGYYFFPEQLWWRAVGRVGFPVWFFLAGHASGRDISPKPIIGGVILVIGNFMVGLPIFPLNALFTILAIRLLIDPIMEPVLTKRISIWVIAAVLFLLVLPSYAVAEYGTQALITAIFGYLVRHRERVNNEDLVFRYMFFALISFVLIQQFLFNFSELQFLIMVSGTALIRFWLYKFEPRKTYPDLNNLPSIIKSPIQFMGRRTLEIYIVHLLIFKFMAVSLGEPNFAWFRLKWI